MKHFLAILLFSAVAFAQLPKPGGAGGGGGGSSTTVGDTWTINEVPSGSINSSNVTFTLSATPSSGKLELYLNGVRQKPTNDYSLSTNTITMVSAPTTGSTMLASYITQTTPATVNISWLNLPVAGCNGGTAALMWDTPTGNAATAPTAACNDTGAIQRPTASFSGSAVNGFEYTFTLPADWTSSTDVEFIIRYVATAASPAGNVEWDVSTVCRAAGESWDGSFNAVQTITDAQAAQYIINDGTISALTTTGCAAGEDMTIRIERDGTNDTSNDTALILSVRIKVGRTF